MLQRGKETIEINSVYGLHLVVLVPIASCWTKCFFSIASLSHMLHHVYLLRAKVFDAVEQMSLQPEMGDMKIRAIIPTVWDMPPWYWHLRGPVTAVVSWKYLMYTVLLTYYILSYSLGLQGSWYYCLEISGQGGPTSRDIRTGQAFCLAAVGVAAPFVPTWSQADSVFRDWWIWWTHRHVWTCLPCLWSGYDDWSDNVGWTWKTGCCYSSILETFPSADCAQRALGTGFASLGMFGLSPLFFLRDTDHQTLSTWDIQLSSKELLWFCSKQLGCFLLGAPHPRFSCHCHHLHFELI